MNSDKSLEIGITKIDAVPKATRLKQICEYLKQQPPVSSPEEAHSQLRAAFKHIEGPLFKAGEIAAEMQVSDFARTYPVQFEEKMILYQFAFKHIILLGENGALDVRANPRDTSQFIDPDMFDKKPTLVRDLLKAEIEKPGKDGLGVWGQTIS